MGDRGRLKGSVGGSWKNRCRSGALPASLTWESAEETWKWK